MILDSFEKFNSVCLLMWKLPSPLRTLRTKYKYNINDIMCVLSSLLQLFESEQYEEAAVHAATSPRVGQPPLFPPTNQSILK